MSPVELQPVEGPLELNEVGVDLPLVESVVADGIWIPADSV